MWRVRVLNGGLDFAIKLQLGNLPAHRPNQGEIRG
jgi:hypothetical protein